MTYRNRVGAELNGILGEQNTMFIYDEEIKILCPDYERIIPLLDANHATQKGKGMATRPPEARYRPAVDAYLKLRAER